METLNPGNPVNKKQIKASITDAIAKQVVGFSREEIARRVEERYEGLLSSTLAKNLPVHRAREMWNMESSPRSRERFRA